MIIEILEVRNCKYSKEDNSLIDCEARFSHLPNDEWFPFTANPNDVTEHGRTTFANAEKGDYGEVAVYEHPSLENEIFNVRAERNRLLADTDWTQNADVPQATKDKWAAYRQELRDLTEGMDTAEKARAVVFPTPPE
jgi:hypothetical protein